MRIVRSAWITRIVRMKTRLSKNAILVSIS
jgi:hypothetical protein